MMNKLTVLFLVIVMIACNRKPFVNHKLKLEQVSEDCREQQSYFRSISNIAGERYEFEKCLPAAFNKDNIKTERKGDTVVVNFDRTQASGRPVVYKVTLDIDSYPIYKFLTIDDQTFMMAISER